MIYLKLADYGKNKEKFERFAEHFVYFGEGIQYIEIKEGEQFPCRIYTLWKDQKDPLNRFNGLFDGRTYGEGRFVLIKSIHYKIYNKEIILSDFDILQRRSYEHNNYFEKPFIFDMQVGVAGSCCFSCDVARGLLYKFETQCDDEIETDYLNLGNLHENPELYEKIK